MKGIHHTCSVLVACRYWALCSCQISLAGKDFCKNNSHPCKGTDSVAFISSTLHTVHAHGSPSCSETHLNVQRSSSLFLRSAISACNHVTFLNVITVISDLPAVSLIINGALALWIPISLCLQMHHILKALHPHTGVFSYSGWRWVGAMLGILWGHQTPYTGTVPLTFSPMTLRHTQC